MIRVEPILLILTRCVRPNHRNLGNPNRDSPSALDLTARVVHIRIFLGQTMLAGSGSGFAALTLSTLPPKLINWVHLIKNDSLEQHPRPQCTAAGVARAQKPTLMRTRTKTHASVKKHTKTHACRHVYTRACWSKTRACACLTPA